MLSADALSSVAYATEEVMRVLMVDGAAALADGPWIAATIAALLVVVIVSYRQTIVAYPSGVGAYVVARDNLGQALGLVAAASLLIDYVLTVAVSISAGVLAVSSALPAAAAWRVEIGGALVGVLALGNLRGLRESARVFGVPVYGFLAVMLALVAAGIWRWASGTATPVHAAPLPTFATGTLTTFALLTAFANGCTAMTGVEAVSNDVPAFKEPSARYAGRTLALMAVLAVTMFLGISVLAHHFAIVPSDDETVISQLARGVFGGRTALSYATQAATMLILVLAANTAYADFPRLASVVARDRDLHDDAAAAQLTLSRHTPDTSPRTHVVIVPIGGVHRAVIEALRYASALSSDVRAVYVNVVPEALPALKRDWPAWGSHVTLVVLQSPYRTMTQPLLDYLERLRVEDPSRDVTVVVPEFVVKRWWHHLLHNQSALTLKAALWMRPHVVSASVPFHLAR